MGSAYEIGLPYFGVAVTDRNTNGLGRLRPRVVAFLSGPQCRVADYFGRSLPENFLVTNRSLPFTEYYSS